MPYIPLLRAGDNMPKKNNALDPDELRRLHEQDLDESQSITKVTQKAQEGADGTENSRQRKSISPSKASALSAPSVSHPAATAAIQRCLPASGKDYRRAVFALARHLKAIPALADADPPQLRPILERWHKLAVPLIDGLQLDEVRIDFLRAWERVKYPAGSGPLNEILQRAKLVPVSDISKQYTIPELRLLVALCYELQLETSGPFFLGCRTAGNLLGVSHNTAWRWLWLLVQDGVLELVEKGSKLTGKASEYRYVGEPGTITPAKSNGRLPLQDEGLYASRY